VSGRRALQLAARATGAAAGGDLRSAARAAARRGVRRRAEEKEEEKEEVEVELRTVAGDGSSSFVRSSSFSVAANHSIEDASCDRSRIASLARCGTAATCRSCLSQELADSQTRSVLSSLLAARPLHRPLVGAGGRRRARADTRRPPGPMPPALAAGRQPSPEQRRAQRCSVLLCAAQLAPLSLAALSLARSGEGVREPLVDL